MCTSSSIILWQRYSFARCCSAMKFGKKLSRSLNTEEKWACRYQTTFAGNRRSWGSAASSSASSTPPGALNKQQAKDLAVRLTSEERDVLISALQECQSRKVKAEYEGQLAAFRWRSTFGRPSRVPSLGDVDPTGSYCAVPDDWLLRKYAETVPQPKTGDLMRVFVANAIPFIGFGFLDNFVMIIAGEHIEAYLGALITMTTMVAAALGNTLSDVLGIGSAVYVERLAQQIGFRPPKLTPIQLNLPRCKNFANAGRVIGVIIGCLLGMTPLLFMGRETKKEDSPNAATSPATATNTPSQTPAVLSA